MERFRPYRRGPRLYASCILHQSRRSSRTRTRLSPWDEKSLPGLVKPRSFRVGRHRVVDFSETKIPRGTVPRLEELRAAAHLVAHACQNMGTFWSNLALGTRIKALVVALL